MSCGKIYVICFSCTSWLKYVITLAMCSSGEKGCNPGLSAPFRALMGKNAKADVIPLRSPPLHSPLPLTLDRLWKKLKTLAILWLPCLILQRECVWAAHQWPSRGQGSCHQPWLESTTVLLAIHQHVGWGKQGVFFRSVEKRRGSCISLLLL